MRCLTATLATGRGLEVVRTPLPTKPGSAVDAQVVFVASTLA